MRGWGDGGLRFWDAKTRHLADEGQESFPWPRTRDRGEPQSNGLTGGVESWEVQVPKEFCDRPCADLVLKRPSESLAWVVAATFANTQARTVARTASPYLQGRAVGRSS